MALSHGLSLAKALAYQVAVINVTEPWATHITVKAAFAFPFEDFEKAIAPHGRCGLSRLLLGSQAQNVVTHSTIPVLTCR